MATVATRMDARLSKIYYSPKGYWKGMAAIKQLATAAKVSEDVAKRWLTKQALWQVYLPGPHYIPRPKFDVSTPNAVHQADLLFLPHDKLPRGKKAYKYALTVVGVASRYKAAEALTSKESDEVAQGFAKIYRHGPLKWIPCGYRPATPSACRSTRSGRACAARTCTSRRCACGSPGWLPCLDCPREPARTARRLSRFGAC